MQFPGARGSHISRTCNFCRMRKLNCSGPVCRSCLDSGHQCTWGGENSKKLPPGTRQYIESLKNRLRILESFVQRCRQEHGGLGDDPASDLNLQNEHFGDDNEMLGIADEDDDDSRALVLEDQDLLHYGPTSIFQYAPESPERRSRFPEIVETTSRCYVLLIDGEDQSHYNPDFEWARHLPPEVPLDRHEHDKLLDLYFKFSASWCLRVVPPLFLRDMWRALSVPHSQIPPKTTHYSPMLHNALVALATAFSDDHRLRNIQSRQYFAQLAKSYIDKECQTPNISVVQALSILGTFHVAQGDHTLGYMYFGMSGRISQALGLGVDCSPCVKANLISRDDMLDRNWAYWTTFCQDVCWSLYVGREFSVSEADKNTIPVPFVDSDFDQLVFHYPPSGLSPQPTYQSRIFAETCELLRIGRHVMVIVNSLDLRSPEIEPISKIDVQLNTWKERLPPELQITSSTPPTSTPHRLMLHLAYWQLVILLHRPLYRRAPRTSSEQEIDHIKLCNRAADVIMDLLGTWRSLYTLRYVPVTFVHAIFSAGTIFLLSTLHATSGVRFGDVSLHSSLSQMDLCLRYLQEVGRSYHCARDVAGILNSLLQKRLKPKPVQGPGQVPPQINSASSSQVPPQMSPSVNTPQPSYFNEVVSGPPSFRDPQGQPSNVYNPVVVNHAHKQAEHSRQSAGWTPAFPPPPGNVPPGPPHPGAVFGPPPMGVQVMGGEGLPMRPLREPMRYDEEYYQFQLGLHQEPSAPNSLTDEDNDRVQQFLNHQRQSFGAQGWWASND